MFENGELKGQTLSKKQLLTKPDQIYPVSVLISSRRSNSDNTVAAVTIQSNWHETDAPNGTEAQANGRSKGQILPPH